MAVDVVELLKLAEEKVKSPSAIIDCFDFSVVVVSEECSKFLGYSTSDVVGKQVFDLGSMSADYVRNALAKMLTEGGVGETKVKTKSGRVIHFKVDFFPLKFGENLYLVAKIYE